MSSYEMSEDEYLVREPEAEYKAEYREGRMVPMLGASPAHAAIQANLTFELALRLRDTPCQVFSSELRIKVAAATFYTYPDLSATCEEAVVDAKDPYTLVNPAVLFEVLSPTTAAYDRGRKFEYYKQIPSLAEYVLVSQEHLRVEHWTRHEAGWNLTLLEGAEAELALRLRHGRISLREIYRKVLT